MITRRDPSRRAESHDGPADGSARSDLLVVVGARPNFVKVAPVVHALADAPDVRVRMLHTGQHYDRELSGAFIDQLALPRPDFQLRVGSGTHAEQTAAVLVGVERILAAEPCHAVLVAGDVNSTMAAALAATKLGVDVIHLESGLRSGDWTMPEEVNRAVTDRVADLLLCPSQGAIDNLLREGVAGDRLALVGNTMIDSLLAFRGAAEDTETPRRMGLRPRRFVLVTLHRPALVDAPERLAEVLAVLEDVARRLPVVFPLHPRTRARLAAQHTPMPERVHLVPPLEYLGFLALEASARLVVTDSGGVQEETSVLGVPCLTYRTTTERPITITAGTNRLIGTDPVALREAAASALDAPVPRRPPRIPLWDGGAGPRAAASILRHLRARQSRVGAAG
jgi:UDP-N-acetylglucosamine 2-epimerase (non-hydrolysing)